MNDKLSEEFLNELFRLCLNDRNLYEITNQYLKFTYIPDENLKKIWKEIQLFTKLNDSKLPKFSTLIMNLRKDKDALEALSEIKSIAVEELDKEQILDSLEQFIKQSMFVELFDSTAELYNKQETDKAFDKFKADSDKLFNFSIKAKYYDKVFGGFDSRIYERGAEALSENQRIKIPCGIPEIDKKTNGGPETGEYVLFLGDSGVGKSMLLTHIGVTAARMGHKVAHFQVEGTRKQCLDRYDAAWTGSLYYDVKLNHFEESRLKKCRNVISKIGEGEIYVEAFESFNTKTVNDVRNGIIQMKKLYGDIKVVILDYLELLEVGDGQNYGPAHERHRQQKISRLLKQLAMEMNVIIYTVTQATALPTEFINDPNFVLTRYNLSEDKGKIRPTDIFITINRTREEAKEGFCRLFFDKFREHASGDIVGIYQNLARARFYDHNRTLKYIESITEDEEELEEEEAMS